MWTPDLVRIRFIEAADTERYLPRPFTATGKGYWPSFGHDIEDQSGWDDAARRDNAQRPATRAPAGAVTRHEECLAWTASRISDQTRRHIVWAYAFCKANKRDFGKLCERRGWVRRTAYDRLTRLWARLADEFQQEGLFLRLPAETWLAQEGPNRAHPVGTMAAVADVPTAIRFTPGFILEKSTDLILTDDDAADFAKFLEARNAAMRREQARRRKLGIIEQVAGSPAA
jgi:hypothetical protein